MEHDIFEIIIKNFMIIWATIDPVGTLALFASLTASFSARHRKLIAFKAICYSAVILLSAILAGQLFLSYMGIQLISFQLSGGIILFLFGLQMIFKSHIPDMTNKEPDHDIAVFPLTIPSIATPGAIMSVIVLTDNQIYDFTTQLITAGVLIVILLITFCFMLLSQPIMHVIGKNGSAILVKVMGMILAALSIEIIMDVLKIPEWTKTIN